MTETCPTCEVALKEISEEVVTRGEIIDSCWVCQKCGCFEIKGKYSKEEMKELTERGVFEGD